MGQKTHPYGFRLGVVTDWKSRWFASRHEYVDNVIEDFDDGHFFHEASDRHYRMTIEDGKFWRRAAPRKSVYPRNLP